MTTQRATQAHRTRLPAALLSTPAVLIVALLAVLGAEAGAASRRTFVDADSAPAVRADLGSGRPLTLAVLGDSTGAGLGVDTGRAEDTVGGQLAVSLAVDGRAVALRGVAVSGARTADLAGQVDRLEALLTAEGRRTDPLVALIVVGANDATHLTGLARVGEELGQAVRRLRALGAEVVVATCPDMGSARAFAQPLRAVAGWRGRAVAQVEAAATREAGGRPVNLAAETGPAFRADPATQSADEFHPSVRGYALWAAALLPATLAAAAAS